MYNDFNQIVRKRTTQSILEMYGVSPEQPTIIKGGEGSRGGKIIGHTKSGKPIYESSIHTSSDFTHEDHSDATSKHREEAKKHNEELKNKNGFSKKWGDSKISKIQHHSSMAELHSKAMNDKLDEKLEVK